MTKLIKNNNKNLENIFTKTYEPNLCYWSFVSPTVQYEYECTMKNKSTGLKHESPIIDRSNDEDIKKIYSL